MMTKRKKAGRTKVKSTNRTLSPMEEKVVRMRHGLTAPDSLVLEQVGQDDPAIAAQLREIEQKAMAAVKARRSPTKRKIVGALRRKGN